MTHNSAAHLPAFAASLPGGLSGVPHWQLVVVDNDSADGTPQLVEQLLPDARVVRSGRNAGYAAGINAGAALAPEDGPILVLNPDVRLHDGCAARLLAALDQDRVGIAAPRLLDDDGALAPSLRQEPSLRRVWAEALLGGRRAARLGLSETVADPAAYESGHDVEWATGAVLAVSAECRRTIGPWDESFFLYSEEVDYCRRARSAGFTVRYVPEAVASHTSGEYGGNVDLWRILVRNRARDYARHHGRVRTTLFRAGLATGEAIRSRGPAHRAGLRAALAPAPPEPGAPPTPGQERGFVWFAAQDWWYHNRAHSDFQLMREVARDRPVLVVNSLGLRLPTRGTSTHSGRRILRKLRSTAKLVRRPLPDNPGFHVMTPLLLPLYGDTMGARLNAWLVRQQVRVVARSLGLGAAPDIGVTIPTAWPVVRRMRRSSLLFNRSDLHSAFPEADSTWVASLEDALLANADSVLYVSHELMRRDAALIGDRGFFLDHGVDVDHFRPDPGGIDPEIAGIPQPRVGFFGGLDDYVVDMDLLRLTAVENPDVSLVLIGDATCPMDDLTSLPNVHWLGFRPYERIPGLGRGFDVALMPWLDNEWIRFANPIKLKEYLALGLPVVTTEYPEVDDYRDRVRVAGERSEFPTLVRAALAEPVDRDELRASILDYSWAARARALVRLTDHAGRH
ncbi:glycosyltransferase [Nocardioides sp. LHG3406-4]|uniref:glycosyltransferase n=1 Tax=Nocardioides sp. LHG3406-4 TaxID=2804575 RepID=UPI003CF295EA